MNRFVSKNIFVAKHIAPAVVASILSLAGCSDDDVAPAQNPPADKIGGQAGNDAGNGTDGGGTTAGNPAAKKDIVDTAAGAGQFNLLVAATKAAGLEETLRGAGPFTVFAPTDDAFKKLPSFLTTKLVTPAYKTELGLLLKYHVLKGTVKAADVLGKQSQVETVQGGKVNVDGSGGKVTINGVAVTTADIMATNGIIHVLDSVLLPTVVDTAAGYDDGTTKFSALVGAVTKAGLVDTLSGAGPFTVFAPTDAAFAALKTQLGDTAYNAIVADNAKLTKILTYHVVGASVYSPDVKPGSVQTVSGDSITIAAANGGVQITDSTSTAANVTLTDLPNRNGVIHVVDKVLLPPNL